MYDESKGRDTHTNSDEKTVDLRQRVANLESLVSTLVLKVNHPECGDVECHNCGNEDASELRPIYGYIIHSDTLDCYLCKGGCSHW